ncbi:agglutinin biogenesis protein MshP [Duganella vulcania]|uniref:Agglutinin biogenesis protein MshP n=1 Tax=Duganella vulcania TaxID=2692166 RepID=A0A845GYK2_9BURK|nr:agglutinin biogenesis protein MshP [Duganella vulcania]MYM98338.1 agglutinin biogenesis protein MshP [Duganella vulcania]
MRPVRQRLAAGFSIVTALFLVVVLAALGVAMMSLNTTQQTSSALDLLGARAYEAARAGVEYGLYQQRINGNCVASRSFGLGGTLSTFTVTVLCTVNATPGMGVNMSRITVTATACNQPAGGVCPNAATTSADYVQRTVTVQF